MATPIPVLTKGFIESTQWYLDRLTEMTTDQHTQPWNHRDTPDNALVLLGEETSPQLRAQAPKNRTVLLTETTAPPGDQQFPALYVREHEKLIALLLLLNHPPVAPIVAMDGALGALGVSTLLVMTAAACVKKKMRVALVDLHPEGGLHLLLGGEELPGLRWADLPDGELVYHPNRIAQALPRWHGVASLSADGRGATPTPEAAGPLLDALAADFDLVLVDLPRGAQLPRPAYLLLLTDLSTRSGYAAENLAHRWREHQQSLGNVTDAGVELLVRKRGEDLWEERLTQMTGAPIAATVESDRAVNSLLVRGQDPWHARGSTHRCGRGLAERLLPLVAVEREKNPQVWEQHSAAELLAGLT